MKTFREMLLESIEFEPIKKLLKKLKISDFRKIDNKISWKYTKKYNYKFVFDIRPKSDDTYSVFVRTWKEAIGGGPNTGIEKTFDCKNIKELEDNIKEYWPKFSVAFGNFTSDKDLKKSYLNTSSV